jgi:hypothetical protein
LNVIYLVHGVVLQVIASVLDGDVGSSFGAVR